MVLLLELCWENVDDPEIAFQRDLAQPGNWAIWRKKAASPKTDGLKCSDFLRKLRALKFGFDGAQTLGHHGSTKGQMIPLVAVMLLNNSRYTASWSICMSVPVANTVRAWASNSIKRGLPGMFTITFGPL